MKPRLTPPRNFRACLPPALWRALALLGVLGSVHAADAPTAAPTPAASKPDAAPRPKLPLEYADFARDYKAKALQQDWLSVQVGELETFYGPPEGQTSFVLPEKKWTETPEISVNYKPLELVCVTGAKSRFDNLMLLDVDKTGHPLGYSVPLGQLIYFLAREETPDGYYFSLHYYHAEDLNWVKYASNPDMFFPVTDPLTLTQDIIAPPESYVFLLLTTRNGPAIPNTPTPSRTFYKYLVVHIHRLTQPPAPLPSSIAVPSGS